MLLFIKDKSFVRRYSLKVKNRRGEEGRKEEEGSPGLLLSRRNEAE